MEKETTIMRNMLIKGDIDEEAIGKILGVSNDVFFDGSYKPLNHVTTIYLSSTGGSVEAAQIIADFINTQPKKFRMVGVGYLASSAFKLFFDVRCDKCLLKQSSGMFHLSRREVELSSSGKPYFDTDRFLVKESARWFKDDLEWCEWLGMTAEQIETVASSEPVFFSYPEMEAFLQRQRNGFYFMEDYGLERRLAQTPSFGTSRKGDDESEGNDSVV